MAEDMLITIAARPAMGKSALVDCIAENVARRGPVLLASLEMSARDLALRRLARHTGIALDRIRRRVFSRGEREILRQANPEVHALDIHVLDSPGLTVDRLCSQARAFRQSRGALALVAVDYLQLLVPGRARESGRTVDAVSMISRELKVLARELRCPVIALSQLSRAVELRANRRPQLSDLRDSGSIEQDSDAVLFIYREDYYNPDPGPDQAGVAEIIVGKQRNGPTGAVRLGFESTTARFFDLPDLPAAGWR